MIATEKFRRRLRPTQTERSLRCLTQRSPQPRDLTLRRPSHHPLGAADLTTTVLPTAGYLPYQDGHRTQDKCDTIRCSTNGSKGILLHSYRNASSGASQGDGFRPEPHHSCPPKGFLPRSPSLEEGSEEAEASADAARKESIPDRLLQYSFASIRSGNNGGNSLPSPTLPVATTAS